MTGPFVIAGFFVLGIALGAFYFLTLKRTVRLHAEHAAPAWIATHYAVRIVAAIAVLILAARAGAWPLLAAFAGFVLARSAVLRGTKREGG